MRSEAHWTSGALRQLLDTKQAERILRAVTQFERSGAGDVKKLSGESNQWRMRVGDYRIYFDAIELSGYGSEHRIGVYVAHCECAKGLFWLDYEL